MYASAMYNLVDFNCEKRSLKMYRLVFDMHIFFQDEMVATDNLLFFKYGISRDQAGEYECVAQNRHGSSTIKTVIDVLCELVECMAWESPRERFPKVGTKFIDWGSFLH